jgi:CHAT domain-containing protein
LRTRRSSICGDWRNTNRSFTSSQKLAVASAASKPMIAFADPVFSKYAKGQARKQVAMRGMTSFVTGTQIDISKLAENLVQLPSTRDEVQAIAKELQVDPSDLKLGFDANVTAIKTAKLDQYRIVYFATHGLVAGDLEKFANGTVEPALAFSIPDMPNDFDNGLLSASEVAQLKLNADWVVLSACNTAAEEKPGAALWTGKSILLRRSTLTAGVALGGR